MTPTLLFCAWLFGMAPQGAAAQPSEKIVDIRVHGNHITPDADVIRLSTLTKGAPFTDATLADAKKALRQTGMFDEVDVLKRFASIDDLSQIVVMIVVNEGPVKIEIPDLPGAEPRIVRRGVGSRFMYMPIIDAEDGYGWRYGLRVALARPVGRDSRLSFPFTWGGERRAGAELEHTFSRGRLQFGGALTSRENPFYKIRDDRRSAWTRVETSARRVHFGVTGAFDHIAFGATDENVKTIGADVVIDTRLDPLLPRNAVYVKASADRLFADIRTDTGALYRTKVDASGYLGLIRQTVLVARVVREDASEKMSPYFKSMLGGTANLRGFHAAEFVGDTLVAGSLELRAPLTSPISFGKVGFRVFADAGTVYDKGQRYEDQTLKQGYGGGLFLTAPVFHLNLDVAHGKGAGTRVYFGGGFSF
ncbi:MAG: outer membrane protein assembly factor [Acidobacteria bacterium]|nr:MAG: outer membrane protein assembly factor [Acidobacteriota bacterium]